MVVRNYWGPKKQGLWSPFTLLIHMNWGKRKNNMGKSLPKRWIWKRNQNMYTLQTKWVCMEEYSSWEEVDHAPKTCAWFLQQWKQANMEAIWTCIQNQPGWEQIQMHEETIETLDLNHNRWDQLQVNVGVLHLLCNSKISASNHIGIHKKHGSNERECYNPSFDPSSKTSKGSLFHTLAESIE